jgi:hypothetical protein
MFIWAISKSKMRYLLGFYTFMITVFLHYSGTSVTSLVADIGQERHGNNMLRATAMQQAAAAAPVSVTSTVLQSQAQSTHPST